MGKGKTLTFLFVCTTGMYLWNKFIVSLRPNLPLSSLKKSQQQSIRNVLFIVTLFALLGVSNNGWAATKTWDRGANTNNWSSANNWNPNGLPQAGDDVIIPSGYSVTLDVNMPDILNSLTIDFGGTLTTTLDYRQRATTITINGTYINESTRAIVFTTMNVNSGGTYQHARNGGAIPTANWHTSSNCNITGIINTVPTVASFDQSFGNFTWNCPSQTGDLSLAANLTTINGNFTMSNTNTGSLRFVNGSNGNTNNISIAGNYIQDGGRLFIHGTNNLGNGGSVTLTLNGSFSLNGGTLNINGCSDTRTTGVTFNIAGNFTMGAGTTLTETGGGTATIIFNGTTTQTYAKSGGTISNMINFSVASGSILDVGTSLIDGSNGTFTLNSGAGITTAHQQGLSTTVGTGSIHVTGTKTYNTGANYTYNGTTAQVTGNGLTGANNLTIDNAAGVTLSNAISVSGTLTLDGATLRSGAITGNAITGGGTLNLANSSTIALGTGDHSLTFANSSGITWNGATLTITGWIGTAGSNGTAGKIMVGTGGLSTDQLAKITFNGYAVGAMIVSGEVVPAPSPPAISGFSPSSGCQGATGIVITGTNFTGATSVNFNGVTASYVVNSSTQITASVPATATTGTISVTTPSGTANSASSFTVNPLPVAAGAISGTVSVCQGASQTYSVTNVSGVTYSWSLPSGWSGTSTTNSIIATVGSNSGTISVTPSNGNCSGIAQTLPVTVSTSVPAQPSIITGSTSPGQGTSQTYSVTNVPGTTYTWSFPSGWAKTAGGTSSSVTVTVGTTSGNVTVTPNNGCGDGTARTLPVAVSVNCTATGTILMERWNTINGTAVTDLTGDANYPATPSTTTQLISFEIPTTVADNYGVRVRGYICAPATGNYTFWIASDDNSELWLSTNDTPGSRQQIASVNDWTNSRQWNPVKYPSQQSTPITLTAGQQYYIEALMKEGTGGDNLAVGWTTPSNGTTTVIPGTVLSPFVEPVTGIVVTPTNTSIAIGYTTALTATVSPNNAANKNVNWSSSNNAIATVNASGVVTGVAVGSVTITATTVDGSFTDDCSVTVTAAPVCITSHPTSLNICAGAANTSFSIETGTGVSTRRWGVSVNGGLTWTPITGAITDHPTYANFTTNILSIGTNTTRAHNGYMYRCVTTGCVDTSNVATLNVGINVKYILSATNDLLYLAGDPTGPHTSVLSLSGSEVGVTYQLRTGTTNVGAPVAGTGGLISFATVGPLTVSTNYNVLASNTCVPAGVQMLSTHALIVNSASLIIDLHPCNGQPGTNFFTNSEFGTTTSNAGTEQPAPAADFPGVIWGKELGTTYTNYDFGFDGSGQVNDGQYVITNSTRGMYNNEYGAEYWINMYDNTQKNATGMMYVVNASIDPGNFYTETLTGLCDSTKYEFSADIINLYQPDVVPNGRRSQTWFPSDGQGGYTSILPNVDFLINDTVAFNTGSIMNDGVWRKVGFTFRTGGRSSITLTMRNNSPGGIGCDMAIDNVVMRACGPKIKLNITTVPPIVCPGQPVTFTGVITASDYITPVYQWQKSTDGGITWINIDGANSTTYTENNTVNGHQYRFITAETIPSLTNLNCYVASNVDTVKTTSNITSTTPATRCTSGTLTLEATANAGSTINWYRSSNPDSLSMFTGTSYTTPILTTPTTYYVSASQGGCTSSPRVPIVATVYTGNVNPKISISASPGTNLCPGNDIIFTATPTDGGTSPLFQWRKNGTNITDETSSTYTTNTLVNNDVITCVVTEDPNITCINGNPGTATSNQLSITFASMSASVSIAASPSNTICNGTSVTFTATPTNGGAIPTYQWKVNGTNVGTNSATYTSTTLANNDQVTCVMTSSFICATDNPATSNTVTMTVSTATAISSQSTATQTQCINGSFTSISVTPTGTGTITYQWYSNTSASTTGGTLLTGATSASYTPLSTTAGTLYYYCIVHSNCGTDVTSAVSGAFIVNPATAISNQSTATQDQCIGGTFASISVTATGVGLSYQWYSNTTASTTGGTSLSSANGAQTNTYTPQTSSSGTLYYYCVVTGTCGTATSAVSEAFIVNPATAIDSQSTATQTQCINGSFTSISVTATGTGTITYQWYSNTSASTIGGTLLAGASSASYTPLATTAGTLYYYCIVHSNCGTDVTSAVSGAFIVNPNNPVSVAIVAEANPVCAGTFVNSTATPTNGGTSPTYKWIKNGFDGGWTGNSYNYQPVNGDVITCIMTSNVSCPTGNPATSDPITMTVYPFPSATLSGNATICTGFATNLSVALSGAQPWSITYSDGTTPVNIDNITSSPHLISVSPSTTTTYTLTAVSDSHCAGTSHTGSALVTVNPLPTISLTNTEALACQESGIPGSLDISSTTNSPNQYSIVFDPEAIDEGFENVTNSDLYVDVIEIAVPTEAVLDTYYGSLTVRNSTTGCVSGSTSISVKVISTGATVSTVNNEDICPDLNNNGHTNVDFRIDKPTSTDSWQFDYSVSEGTFISVTGNSATPPERSGNTVDAKDNTIVYMRFQIENDPGTEHTVTLTITSVTDDITGCQKTYANNNASQIIKEMPVVGPFN